MEFRSGRKKRKDRKTNGGRSLSRAIAVNYIGGKEEGRRGKVGGRAGEREGGGYVTSVFYLRGWTGPRVKARVSLGPISGWKLAPLKVSRYLGLSSRGYPNNYPTCRRDYNFVARRSRASERVSKHDVTPRDFTIISSIRAWRNYGALKYLSENDCETRTCAAAHLHAV